RGARAVLDVAIVRPAQRFGRIVRRHTPGERAVEVGEAFVDDAFYERRLVAEVMIDRRGGDAGARAELADRQALLAARRQQPLGRFQDRTPGRRRLGVTRAPSVHGHLHWKSYSIVICAASIVITIRSGGTL